MPVTANANQKVLSFLEPQSVLTMQRTFKETFKTSSYQSLNWFNAKETQKITSFDKKMKRLYCFPVTVRTFQIQAIPAHVYIFKN